MLEASAGGDLTLVAVYPQVHTLLKGLEKIAHSADIPMLVAGDFNSVPTSAAYGLIVKKQVDQGHPVCPPCPCMLA